MTNGFYSFTTKLRELIESDDDVNTMTYGSIFDVPTEKLTIYPLAHLMTNSVEIEDNLYKVSVTILFMDLLDISKEDTTDLFVGNDNLHDVFNTQLMVATKLSNNLKTANLRNEGFMIEGNPRLEQFKHKFTEGVAGWTMSFDVLTRQNVSIC